jgi:tRNA-dihydrouridine synthase A
VSDDAQIEAHLQHVDGVMVGREAYHHPWRLAGWDARFFGDPPAEVDDRDEVERRMVEYMTRQAAAGVPWPHVARHMLGLMNGRPGARRWRQVWSDHRLKGEPPAAVWQRARQALQGAVEVAA